jgi:hypothetical protein
MVLLRPVCLLSRLKIGCEKLSPEQKRKIREDKHRIPVVTLNLALTAVFTAETPIGHSLSFQWETWFLGVFHK